MCKPMGNFAENSNLGKRVLPLCFDWYYCVPLETSLPDKKNKNKNKQTQNQINENKQNFKNPHNKI